MKQVYLDNSATTPIDSQVLEAMLPFLSEVYGNPSSIHSVGRKARVALDDARFRLAKTLGAKEYEIYFTSGGTESDNIAMCGVLRKTDRNKRILTTNVEHSAILQTGGFLENEGAEVVFLPVSEDGKLSPETLENALKEKETALVSAIFVNNEIGTINDIKTLTDITHKYGACFHTDAVQAFGKIQFDVKELGVDLLSISGHKIYAPKGIGALYVKKEIDFDSCQKGGGQERGKRSGTENVAGSVALARAAELCLENYDEERKRITYLRDKLETSLLEKIEGARINGSKDDRLYSILNISFTGIPGESLIMSLDLSGICASAGSACASGSLSASPVLKAVGLSDEEARSAIRFSIGRKNTEEEIDYVIEQVPILIERLRAFVVK
ncbi:MAG: cysteine desulfurase [Calditrichaeota bacterium]|nr:MAG: cysteine desulfurase [Calditrichota bacterium]